MPLDDVMPRLPVVSAAVRYQPFLFDVSVSLAPQDVALHQVTMA